MGADGGSIPKRVELVKTKMKSYTMANDQRQAYLDNFKYCALSKESLRSPVVICKLGRLYNKEAILSYLLSRKFPKNSPSQDHDALEKVVAHIKTMNDLKLLNLTENPASHTEKDHSKACPFICPVTGKEMNGHFKFFYLKGCGCVFSGQALREVSTRSCLTCGKDREDGDDLGGICVEDPKRDLKLPEGDEHERVFPTNGMESVDRKRPLTGPTDEPIGRLGATFDDFDPKSSRLAAFKKSAAVSSLYKN